MTIWTIPKRLSADPALFRTRWGTYSGIRVVGLTARMWAPVGELVQSSTPIQWDILLLDAEGALIEGSIGVAVVLAFAALETFIAWALQELAARTSKIDAALWDWINTRSGDHYKQPSVQESFDVLLKVLAGESLIERPPMWEGLAHLNQARNTFVHAGTAVVGKKKTVVDLELAGHLVSNAREVIALVEKSLPEKLRRPIEPGPHTFKIEKRLM